MRTELHHHHHHHQVPTCGIKHKVLHRTHLRKKRLNLDSYQKYYHIVYKICQLALITLLHSVQQLHNFGKTTPGHSLSFKAATTPHPSTCPRDILTILTGKKRCRISIISIFYNLEQNLNTTSSFHLLWNLCNKPYSQ